MSVKLNLQLNDFEGFETALFTKEERAKPGLERFYKFWDDILTAVRIPIWKDPETIVEYQFCHYIYWMTIAAMEQTCKPFIFRKWCNQEFEMFPQNQCFACQYTSLFPNCKYCPIKKYRIYHCYSPDTEYKNFIREIDMQRNAIALAKLEWCKVDSVLFSC